MEIWIESVFVAITVFFNLAFAMLWLSGGSKNRPSLSLESIAEALATWPFLLMNLILNDDERTASFAILVVAAYGLVLATESPLLTSLLVVGLCACSLLVTRHRRKMA